MILTQTQTDYLLKVLHEVDTKGPAYDQEQHADVTRALLFPGKQRVDLHAIPFELLRVAAGHEMNLGPLVGHPRVEVWMRLTTAEEFQALQHRLAREGAAQGGYDVEDGPGLVSIERARELTKPLILPGG